MNRAERIAAKIRAKAKRAKAKRYKRPKREDFRAAIMAAILDAEAEAAQSGRRAPGADVPGPTEKVSWRLASTVWSSRASATSAPRE